MRYIYYIIFILLGLSAIIGYELRSKNDSFKEAALIINGRVITTDEFNKLYSSRPSHVKEKSDFINSLITKELLIQESQKEGIDKEESFRRSIQNFYEQSLIKLLIDRKFASLNITVSDEEINRYIAFLNKKLHLTMFSFDSLEEATRGNYGDGESKTIYFEGLCEDIRYCIISLKEGEMTKPIKIGEKYVVVRLDKVEISPLHKPSTIDKDRIKRMLTECKKEKMINDWITDLREKASIKILLNVKD
jgi:parvulin-like peptidyl-prolyl isomerase